MTTRRFETWLRRAIELTAEVEGEDHQLGIEHVEDFVQAGLATTVRGLVVTFADGSEIRLSLVLSRPGPEKHA